MEKSELIHSNFAIASKCIAELIVDGRSEVPIEHYALDRPLP